MAKEIKEFRRFVPAALNRTKTPETAGHSLKSIKIKFQI